MEAYWIRSSAERYLNLCHYLHDVFPTRGCAPHPRTVRTSLWRAPRPLFIIFLRLCGSSSFMVFSGPIEPSWSTPEWGRSVSGTHNGDALLRFGCMSVCLGFRVCVCVFFFSFRVIHGDKFSIAVIMGRIDGNWWRSEERGVNGPLFVWMLRIFQIFLMRKD